MEKRFAYVGICKCGSMISACVDDELVGRKEVAKFCSETIKDGLTLDRVNLEEVRVRLHTCLCDKDKIKEPKLF